MGKSKWKIASRTRSTVSILSSISKALASQDNAGSIELRVTDVDAEEQEQRTLVLPSQPTLGAARDAICEIFGWDDCQVLNVSDSLESALDNDKMLLKVMDEYDGQEEARKRDLLEAHLERSRTMLISRRTDLHIAACHMLWELACRPENHPQLTPIAFSMLVDAASSKDLATRFLGCAAVWGYAEVDTTLRRLPVARLVALFLDMVCGGAEVDTADGEDQDVQNVEEEGEQAASSPKASTSPKKGFKAKMRAAAVASAPVGAVGGDALTLAEQLSIAKCATMTGVKQGELLTWPAGALHALLACEAGMRAFHARKGEARCVAVLAHARPPLKRALVAIFTRVAANSAYAGLTLLSVGAMPLVRCAPPSHRRSTAPPPRAPSLPSAFTARSLHATPPVPCMPALLTPPLSSMSQQPSTAWR